MKNTLVATGLINVGLTLTTLYCIWASPHGTNTHIDMCGKGNAYIFNTQITDRCL